MLDLLKNLPKPWVGKTWLMVVREVYPEASEEEATFLLWEYTGFPSFWNIGVDGDTPAECCITQLQNLKNSERNSEELEDAYAAA